MNDEDSIYTDTSGARLRPLFKNMIIFLRQG